MAYNNLSIRHTSLFNSFCDSNIFGNVRYLFIQNTVHIISFAERQKRSFIHTLMLLCLFRWFTLGCIKDIACMPPECFCIMTFEDEINFYDSDRIFSRSYFYRRQMVTHSIILYGFNRNYEYLRSIRYYTIDFFRGLIRSQRCNLLNV